MIKEMKVGSNWQGPIESGYGHHLVLINTVVEPRPYQYEEIAEQLQNDYQYDFQLRMNDDLFSALLDKYEVVLDFEEEEAL
jgi:hypothetical protein